MVTITYHSGNCPVRSGPNSEIRETCEWDASMTLLRRKGLLRRIRKSSEVRKNYMNRKTTYGRIEGNERKPFKGE